MIEYIKSVALLALIFTLTDFGYLFSMTKNFQVMIKNIQKSELKMKILPTIACYIFLVGSLYYFIIHKKGSYIDAFLLGLFIYGVYETTNSAIFTNWNIYIAIVDTLWGGLLFLITTYFYYSVIKYVKYIK